MDSPVRPRSSEDETSQPSPHDISELDFQLGEFNVIISSKSCSLHEVTQWRITPSFALTLLPQRKAAVTGKPKGAILYD